MDIKKTRVLINDTVNIKTGPYKDKDGVVIGIYGEIEPFHYLIRVGTKEIIHKGDEIVIVKGY